MKIWVDADACPRVIKEILYRAAERVKIELTLVANQPLATPPSPYIKSVKVPGGFDVADHRIVQSMDAGDLVVTADIPLAALVIEKCGLALDPRGDLYTESNIGERLAAVADYHGLVEPLERLLQSVSGDLSEFYAEVKELGDLAPEDRLERLGP